MASMLLLLGLLVNLHMLTDANVGVCNGRLGNNLPSEQETVDFYRSNRISRMRIYDTNHTTLEALKGTNIELMVGVPNDRLQELNDPNAANTWVNDNIVKYSNVNFKYIAVGNEVDPDNKDTRQYKDYVLPAMQNVHKALSDKGLANKIMVSTATYTGLLRDTYPPSQAAFKDNSFAEPIVRFLAKYKLPMLANIYPYFGYINTEDRFKNLSYALFTAQGTVVPDPNNTLQYSNLFDAMLDAHYAAQARVGGENVKIVVSESGWPSARPDSEVTVETVEYAETYYRGLIEHVKKPTGTPLKSGPIETYLFAMFDENTKTGDPSEKHFGLFSPDKSPKYKNLSFN